MKRYFCLLALPFLGLACATLEPAVGKKPEPAGSGAAADFQEKEARALLDHATELYGQKKYNEAKYQAEALIEKHPSSALVPDAGYLMAKMRFDNRETDAAIREAETLADRYPQSAAITRIRKLLGDCFLAKAEYLKAGQQYFEALRTASGEEQDDIRDPLAVILAERLGGDELRTLYRKYPQSALAPALGIKLAGMAIADQDEDGAKKLLAEIAKNYPGTAEAVQAAEMLTQLRQPRQPAAAGGVDNRLIGVLAPLTGRFSEYGLALKQGAEMAFDEHNQGAVNKLKLTARDTKGDPIDAVRQVNWLADSARVLGVIGDVLSGPTVAAAGTANALGMPIVSPTATEERIATIGPCVFQMTQSTSWQGAAAADYAINKLNFKALAVLHPRETSWENVAGAFAQEAAKQGAPVAVVVDYEPGTTDFKDIVGRLKQARIQALFIPAPPSDIVMIAPQLVYNLLKVQLLGTDSWGDPKILLQGGVYVEGAIFPVAAPNSGQAQAAAAFEQKFKKKYGKAPSKLAAQAYDGSRIMLQALARGPADREDLRIALQKVEISTAGVSGPIAMGKTRARPKAKFMTIRNQQVVELE
ncbi:MAG: ABC transporter substrate-binding protein [Candidatus Edwardsbacteria bacterium]|nr:ABC transporter substrate-binding protein [Candidatus Edwardsbacteria bacterium]